MPNSRLQPKIVLWWGIALTIVGTLLIIFLPDIAYYIGGSRDSAAGVDQGLLLGFDLVVRIISAVVTPLGVVLIGVSIVMAYVRQLLRPTLGAMVTARTESTRRDF